MVTRFDLGLRKMIVFGLTGWFLLLWHLTYCQTVHGKALTERGTGAAKVNVSFGNKDNKIVTSEDGSFTITAKKLPDTLFFSGIGFEPYKVVVTEKNIKDINFEVVLLGKRDGMALSEWMDKKSDMAIPGPPGGPIRGEVFREVEGPTVSLGKKDKKRKSPGADKSVKERTKSMKTFGTPVEEEYLKTKSPRPMMYASDYAGGAGMANGKKTRMLDSLEIGKDSIVSKTKILTAGEVNDFQKWKLWEDLTTSEFDKWARHWQMFPKKRFCVQLTNAKRKALPNKKVWLKDRHTGQSVWEAKTDNTGKAELWYGIDGTGEEEDHNLVLGAENSKEILAPLPFEKGINQLVAKQDCDPGNLVDIAFVVDATGSMGDEIEFLKLELEDVISKTIDKHPELDIHTGSVFYRDLSDEWVTRKTDLQDNLLKTLNFVKLQGAGGGGDLPEAMDSGFAVALHGLSWREEARTRLLFLILDAPPHQENKGKMMELVREAAAKGIRVVPLACSGTQKDNEFLLRAMALATNGTYAFLTDHSGVGGTHTEPSTDAYDVELLNNLLGRIIDQFVYVTDCTEPKPNEPFQHEPDNNASIIVTPNPTQGDIKIKSTIALKELALTDFTGKIILKFNAIGKNGWETNIASFPPATYLIRYLTADGKIGAQKIVLVK